MFNIPQLTQELLNELGNELGGCKFTDESQIEFLENVKSCDVQAAPGNGKTTLLAAKLALLSKFWVSQRQGVCVISHTNTARTEVENLIANHPTASRLMSYPHFTGTVTTFIHQYIAFPYLRGLGWPVRQIDDNAFEEEALRLFSADKSYSALKYYELNAKESLNKWIGELTIDPTFEDVSQEPISLKVLKQKRQPSATTSSGIALAKLKAAMVRRGIYRYADMTALASRALTENSALAERLRNRFPLVMLDEAQDTNGDQLMLLKSIFEHEGSVLQCLGDSNQTLYEDTSPSPTYWTPREDCIPLDKSRRFGKEIGDFASKLTVRKNQSIEGLAAEPSLRVMFLFDEATIGDVLGAFANAARAHWGDSCSSREVWAVASRHNQTSNKGEWKPKSLVDYHPAYRSEGAPRRKPNYLCVQLRKAAVSYVAERAPAEIGEILATGIAGLAHVHGLKTADNRLINASNVWRALSHCSLELPRKVRRLLRDYVLAGDAVWDPVGWKNFMDHLLPLFPLCPEGTEANITSFCEFVEDKKIHDTTELRSTKKIQFNDLTLKLGSIHSVKGKSADGVLVVESEIWKGPKGSDQCMDLSTVLPYAFGVTNQQFNGVELNAATNVFVGITRARELLGLALRKSEAEQLIGPAKDQGWKVVDLVKSAVDMKS